MHLDRDRLRSGLLLAGAIGFAVLGQYYFIQRREYLWDGVVFFGIALICFLRLAVLAAGTARVGREDHGLAPGWRQRARRILGQRRTAAVGLALLLNLAAARSANTRPPPASYHLSVLLWPASLVLLYATFSPFPHLLQYARRAVRHKPQHAAELALVVGLLFTGLLLRVWNLEHIPANLSGDEGTQGMWAVDVLEGRLRNPFSTGWFTVPTMSFFAQAASLQLFGQSMAGLRTLSALMGTASLVFTYLLARRSLGRQVALFALATLTFNHYHIHFSRLGSNQIADSLFAALSLWLLTEGLRRARSDTDGTKRNVRHWFLITGLTIGLSWYGYFGSRVIVLVIAAYLGAQTLAERAFLRRHARALVLMSLMAFMAVSPLLLHYADFPENLSARFNQVNFFRWLEAELGRPNHDSAFNLVARQVWRSISAFNYSLDPTYWYRARIPLLDFVSGILFVLGLAVAASQWRRAVARLILLWFGLAVIFGWILTENPPSSMRMLVATPAVALLVALGLEQLLVLARRVVGGRGAQWNRIGSTLLALAAVLNVHYYFSVYTPTRVYGNPTAETSTVLARYLHNRSVAGSYPQLGSTATQWGMRPFVYFYGPPFLYFDFGTIQFIARDVRGVSVPPLDQDPDFGSPVEGPTLFIVLRERLDELTAIQTQHPYGTLYEFHSEVDGRLMFVVYEVVP